MTYRCHPNDPKDINDPTQEMLIVSINTINKVYRHLPVFVHFLPNLALFLLLKISAQRPASGRPLNALDDLLWRHGLKWRL